MTVTYTSEVTTCSGISCFLKLLLRWRGSIYKLVWVDLFLYLLLYYAINFCYHFIPNPIWQQYFEKLIKYCDTYSNRIPLSFILGFYVSLVMTRWWSQYCSIPFPDNLAILIGASVKGQMEQARIVRRTIVRYACATFTITLTMLSPRVKKRFPTFEHFVSAGLLTKDEVKIMNDLDNEFPSYSKYWLPLAWAANVVTRARNEGLIRDDVSVKTILEELNLFRSKCGGMLDYDWISVPLVYTQVVTLVVYCYFIVSAIGRQYILSDESHQNIDLYFPFFLVIEFFFYMGWLKVAEVLINPYGDDDDDFEVVWMVDRHLQVCYLLVDKIHEEHPKLMRDSHWNETAPNSLPFTIASKNYMQEYPFPSTMNVKVNRSAQDLLLPIEETISQPDGMRRRSSQYLWRVRGLQASKKKRTDSFPLTKVISFHQDSDVNDQANVYDSDVQSDTPKTTEIPCEEFENLKRNRIESHKKKLLEIVELWKGHK
ncbi:bestrophin-3-like [Tribolium madens]|uniref:bestrophin-3-like n=1 Tax=Tribolium madens TaxID=41895 RepID=UPI001CF7337F|nr:bestrophin-3-like [Tribolium madens]